MSDCGSPRPVQIDMGANRLRHQLDPAVAAHLGAHVPVPLPVAALLADTRRGKLPGPDLHALYRSALSAQAVRTKFVRTGLIAAAERLAQNCGVNPASWTGSACGSGTRGSGGGAEGGPDRAQLSGGQVR